MEFCPGVHPWVSRYFSSFRRVAPGFSFGACPIWSKAATNLNRTRIRREFTPNPRSILARAVPYFLFRPAHSAHRNGHNFFASSGHFDAIDNGLNLRFQFGIFIAQGQNLRGQEIDPIAHVSQV